MRTLTRFLIYLAVALILSAAGSRPALAQIPIKLGTIHQTPPDSIDLAMGSKRHFWRAAAEVFGFNMGLWAFDRYVQKGDFAYISLNSIKENFKHGFIWDNDKLGTNTFLHPYNGSLYYNAGRANGFNYWQSELFAIAGSGMWEMFMECEYPSTNDFIATPIGGAAIGEVLFRASDALLDDRTRGFDRFRRELAAFVISPIRGFNRIITGQAWRWRPTRGRIFGTPSFAFRVSAGLKVLQYQGRWNHMMVGFAARLDAEYGDRFEVRSTKPYDYFTIKAELQGMKSQPILSQLEIKGRLLAREFLESKRTHMSLGLYQHFDFYDSDTVNGVHKVPYKLGIPASVGVGLMYRDVERRKWVFDAYAHVNGVLLGSVLSDYYTLDERNYNWANGFSIKGGFNLVFAKNRLSLSVNHEFYRLFTWKGYPRNLDLEHADYKTLNVMGDKSVASFNVTDIRLDFILWKHLYGALSFTNYVRSTHYRDYPHVLSSSSSIAFLLSYKL